MNNKKMETELTCPFCGKGVKIVLVKSPKEEEKSVMLDTCAKCNKSYKTGDKGGQWMESPNSSMTLEFICWACLKNDIVAEREETQREGNELLAERDEAEER